MPCRLMYHTCLLVQSTLRQSRQGVVSDRVIRAQIMPPARVRTNWTAALNTQWVAAPVDSVWDIASFHRYAAGVLQCVLCLFKNSFTVCRTERSSHKLRALTSLCAYDCVLLCCGAVKGIKVVTSPCSFEHYKLGERYALQDGNFFDLDQSEARRDIKVGMAGCNQ